jgi:hypothetical protein
MEQDKQNTKVDLFAFLVAKKVGANRVSYPFIPY